MGVCLGFHRLVIVVQFVEGSDRLELVVDVIDCVHGGGDKEEDGFMRQEVKKIELTGILAESHTTCASNRHGPSLPDPVNHSTASCTNDSTASMT